MATQHIIMIGNPVDGINLIGPFNSRDKARAYAESHLDDEQWNIASLTSPVQDEEDEDYDDEPEDYPNDWDDEEGMRNRMFADPGGTSALRAATKSNPRNLPCPTCGWPNRLTPADRAAGYQCNSCADANETGREINYYDD